MQTIKRILLLTAILTMTTVVIGRAANTNTVKTTIDAIISNPNLYADEAVQFSGLVTTYIPADANTTAYYLIKGDYGNVIRVNTAAGAPETNMKYCVSGIVYVQKLRKSVTIFVSEQSRKEGSCNDVPIIGISQQEIDFGKLKVNSSGEAEIIITNAGTADLLITDIAISNDNVFELNKPANLNLPAGASEKLIITCTPGKFGNFTGILTIRSNASNTLNDILVKGSTVIPISWIIALAAAFVLLVILLILFINKRKIAANVQNPNIKYTTSNPINTLHNGTSSDPVPAFVVNDDLETITIPKTTPGTVKLFPGEFEVKNGADAGKKFKMPAFVKDNGLVVTVGREKPGPDMAQFHIQLKENTVSRKQAEFIYKNGAVYLKNLGTTNHSIVDGSEIMPDQTVELKPGSVNQFGEVILQYSY